jgi:hypothetical protein
MDRKIDWANANIDGNGASGTLFGRSVCSRLSTGGGMALEEPFPLAPCRVYRRFDDAADYLSSG